jgi:hypothetical protein
VTLHVRRVATTTLFALLAMAPAVQAQAVPQTGGVVTQGGIMSTDTTGPSAIRFKGVSIAPIGYFAGEGVFRSRNETADMGSSFNSIPFGNTTNGRLTEFRGSGRQSRLGLLVRGDPGDVHLTGYFESDFLSSGTSSNSVESNSYTLRIRQFFAQAAWNSGFTISSGQMWSLLTTNKHGADNLTQATPPTIDAQYVPGFDWDRQWGIRIAQSVANKQATFALAAESPQMTVGGHGAPTQTFIGNLGGSQLNAFNGNYSTDIAPDVIGKIAFDPKGIGHFELKAIGRLFRDRVVDPACEIGCSKTAVREGGGVGFGAFVPIVPHYLDLTLEGLWGAGIGRYGTSMLPDVVVRPNGIIDPVKAAHAMGGLDIHATHKLDIYLYGGVEYAYRTAFQTAAATLTKPATYVGYGSPTANNNACDTEVIPTGEYAAGAPTCSADTKAVFQFTPGFWYKFYAGQAGTFQWGMQYSYTQRNTWSGLNGYSPLAIDNMVFTSIRYYWP